MTIQHTAFGILTPEHEHPVFNERAVRGAAGLFLMLGVSGWMVAAAGTTGASTVCGVHGVLVC